MRADEAVTPPERFVYEAELLTGEEKAELLAELEVLRFGPIVLHGQAARRTARHYGLGYDYQARTPQPGEPNSMTFRTLRSGAGSR